MKAAKVRRTLVYVLLGIVSPVCYTHYDVYNTSTTAVNNLWNSRWRSCQILSRAPSPNLWIHFLLFDAIKCKPLFPLHRSNMSKDFFSFLCSLVILSAFWGWEKSFWLHGKLLAVYWSAKLFPTQAILLFHHHWLLDCTLLPRVRRESSRKQAWKSWKKIRSPSLDISKSIFQCLFSYTPALSLLIRGLLGCETFYLMRV